MDKLAKIKADLKEKFCPLGIVAYSECCTSCTGVDEFENQEKFMPKFMARRGINLFPFYLGGGNICRSVNKVYCHYDSLNWLREHWDEECKLIEEWASIADLAIEPVLLPQDQKDAIVIRLSRPFRLPNELFEYEPTLD